MRAIGPAIDTVNELGTNLQFTRDARKAVMIANSLQIYAIAKGIGRDPRVRRWRRMQQS